MRRIKHVSEVSRSYSFLMDTSFNDDCLVTIYPITKKSTANNDLLRLYGTHWKYFVNVFEWGKPTKQDLDVEDVLRDIKFGTKTKRFSAYTTTQRNLDDLGNLWVFEPNTNGWEYCNDVLIPKYNHDLSIYKQMKKNAINSI